MIATRGTAAHLEKNGVDAEVVLKIQEGRPNASDLLKNKDITMMFITSTGKEVDVADGRNLRRLALALKVPIITTMAGANATVQVRISHPRRSQHMLQNWRLDGQTACTALKIQTIAHLLIGISSLRCQATVSPINIVANAQITLAAPGASSFTQDNTAIQAFPSCKPGKLASSAEKWGVQHTFRGLMSGRYMWGAGIGGYPGRAS